MKEEILPMMFTTANKIGSEVVCKVWEAGTIKTYEGVLVDVTPFDFINVDRNIIRFVGNTQAIEEIRLKYTDIPLYINHRVQGYEGYYERDFIGLIAAQQELLGRSIKQEEIDARLNSGKKK